MPISLSAGQSGILEDAVWISPLGSRNSSSARISIGLSIGGNPDVGPCGSRFVESQIAALQLGLALSGDSSSESLADNSLFHAPVGKNEILEILETRRHTVVFTS